MIIFGVDPGYAIVGYGAIYLKNGKYQPVGYGAVFTQSEQSFCLRLEEIYDKMCVLLRKCKPDAFAIEKLYFQNNQKTAIGVAEARGVILLAAQKEKIPIYEYTPLQVKIAVTGYGKADKKQVMNMTKRLLNLQEMPKPDDTTDALAVAICHANARASQLKNKFLQRGYHV